MDVHLLYSYYFCHNMDILLTATLQVDYRVHLMEHIGSVTSSVTISCGILSTLPIAKNDLPQQRVRSHARLLISKKGNLNLNSSKIAR